MIAAMNTVQNTLSEFQSIPIVGTFVGSPIKALVSTIEIIMGIAAAILFGPIYTLTNSTTCRDIALVAGFHTIMGMGHLLYSVANFATLGTLQTMLRNVMNMALQMQQQVVGQDGENLQNFAMPAAPANGQDFPAAPAAMPDFPNDFAMPAMNMPDFQFAMPAGVHGHNFQDPGLQDHMRFMALPNM